MVTTASMTIDHAREIVEHTARHGVIPETALFVSDVYADEARDRILQALCVVVNACGMRPVSDAELRGQFQQLVDADRDATKAHEGAR